MTKFNIHATGDVVTGDTIEFTEGVFGGSFRNPKYIGERKIRAKVIKDSYGLEKQQHTFTLEVIKSSGEDAIVKGKKIRRKGRNVYRNGTMRIAWKDESQRKIALAEKHERGDCARSDRELRREDEGYHGNY